VEHIFEKDHLMIKDPTYLPPVAENLRAKDEVLEWDTIPTEPCVLNYRVPTGAMFPAACQILGLFFLTALCMVPMAYLIGDWLGPSANHFPILTLALVATAVVGIALLFRPTLPNTRN